MFLPDIYTPLYPPGISIHPEACANLMQESGMSDEDIGRASIKADPTRFVRQVPLDLSPTGPAVAAEVQELFRITDRAVTLSIGSIALEAGRQSRPLEDIANATLASGLLELAHIMNTPPESLRQQKLALAASINRRKIVWGAFSGLGVAALSIPAFEVAREVIGPPVPAFVAVAGAAALTGVVARTRSSYLQGVSETITRNNMLRAWPYQIACRQNGEAYAESICEGKKPPLINID